LKIPAIIVANAFYRYVCIENICFKWKSQGILTDDKELADAGILI
jgi:hypothetical protein